MSDHDPAEDSTGMLAAARRAARRARIEAYRNGGGIVVCRDGRIERIEGDALLADFSAAERAVLGLPWLPPMPGATVRQGPPVRG